MHRISQEIHPRERVQMLFFPMQMVVVMLVAMLPMNYFLHNKKRNDAS
jgi:hypothetical protein